MTTHALRDQTVAEIAIRLAGATSVFRRREIDVCDCADVPLAEAAAAQGLDIAELEAALEALGDAPSGAPQDTPGLVHHILTRFHDTHRRELPELAELARRVEAAHPEHPLAPRGLADLLQRALVELGDHMAKEEQVLFPAMQAGYRGSLEMPIRVMRHEHEAHADLLRALEHLTRGFAAPEDACPSWRALYVGAQKFAADLAEHLNLENNVLFPRFERRRS